jgi:hypothetical protein
MDSYFSSYEHCYQQSNDCYNEYQTDYDHDDSYYQQSRYSYSVDQNRNSNRSVPNFKNNWNIKNNNKKQVKNTNKNISHEKGKNYCCYVFEKGANRLKRCTKTGIHDKGFGIYACDSHYDDL